MFRCTCKTIAAAAASVMAWGAVAATVAQLPVVSAATITPPYSCPAVYDALIAMQDAYPDGTPWTNDDFYEWNGGGMYYGGYGCVSFAYLLSDAAFGYLPCEEPLDYDPATLRVGDMIRYGGHTVVILEVRSSSFIVAEGNYNSSVNWGREISFDSIADSVEYCSSRYPEEFAFRESEAAIDIGTTVMPAVISRDAVDLTWESLDPTIASVDANGVICGLDNGIATITADNGTHAEIFTVTVGDPDAVPAIPEGLVYTVDTENGTVTITGYEGTETMLTIPEQIEGLPVTAIGSWAFPGNTTVTDLTLPDTITDIAAFAFFDCGTLEHIVLPASLKTIGKWAFYYSGLQSLLIPAAVESIGNWACSGIPNLTAFAVNHDNPYYCSMEGVLYDAAMETLIAYPAGKTDSTYTIYDDVTTIAPGAFGGALYVQQLEIPASVTNITQSTFELAVSLENFVVDSDNSAYCDAEGVLYSKDGKTLLAYPIARSDSSYTIQPGTEIIANSAFAYSTALTEITLPNSLTTIGEWAFTDCSGLTHVRIPSRVTAILRGAFSYCTALADCFIPPSVTVIGDETPVGVFDSCDNLTITGYSGSYAETYANENDVPFAVAPYPTGDINRDGLVTIADAILLNRIIAEDDSIDPESITVEALDCNGDGDVNVDDSVWILRDLAGLQ